MLMIVVHLQPEAFASTFGSIAGAGIGNLDYRESGSCASAATRTSRLEPTLAPLTTILQGIDWLPAVTGRIKDCQAPIEALLSSDVLPQGIRVGVNLRAPCDIDTSKTAICSPDFRSAPARLLSHFLR
jgi:hypothetical protein